MAKAQEPCDRDRHVGSPSRILPDWSMMMADHDRCISTRLHGVVLFS
jgi:hypothetical protein